MKTMRTGWRFRFCWWLSLVALPVVVSGAPLADEALIDALRGGGYNLYFRHVATDWSQQDRVASAGDWTSCDATRMRQLSDTGRSTARAVGDAMRRLGIPVQAVLASPYCRTVETARELGLGPVTPTNDVINMRIAEHFGGRSAVIDSARRLLSTPPAPGANRVIVAHGNVARDSTPVYPDEGEAVVFRPDGRGGFEVAGRLHPADWQRLSRSIGVRP